MLQKDAKLIFISSVNSSDTSTSFLYKLKSASEKMLNVVSYVCQDHKEEFDLQDTLVSCPCYRLHIPTYISISDSIRNTTNLFLDGAFATELMGECSSQHTGAGLSSASHRIITEQSITQLDICRIDTSDVKLFPKTGNGHEQYILYLYIDPAYTNNQEASGTGIGALVRAPDGRMVILGLEHYFLRDLSGAAPLHIATCAASLIRSISVLNPFITTAKVAVEGNSSQDSAVAIATFLNEASQLPLAFIHYTDKTSGLQWPIYLLGAEKSRAFENFIYSVNSGKLAAAQVVVSNTIKLSFDPITYLVEQIKAIKTITLKDGSLTYTAKQPKLSDDTLVAVVMAHHLANTEGGIYRSIDQTNKETL